MKNLLCALFVLMPLAGATAQEAAAPVKLPEKATEVQSGASTAFTFKKPGEIAWIKIDVKAAGSLTFDGHGHWYDRTAGVQLFDSQGRRVGSGDAAWHSVYRGYAREQFWSARVAAGVHYLRVTCTKTNGRAYYVRLATEPADGDDARDRARPLGPGKPVSLRIAPAGDVDHYRFEVKKPGWAVFHRYRGQRVYVKLSYTLLDASGKEIAKGSPSITEQTDGDMFWAAPVEPGTYTAAVRAPVPFTDMAKLTLSLIGEDLYELGDSPADAVPVPVNQPIPILLLPAGDVDWLRFSVPHDGVLAVFQAGGRNDRWRMKCELQQQNVDGKPAVALSKMWTNWPKNDCWSAAPLTKGEYLLKLSGAPNPKSRSIRLEFERELDPNEPNNDPSQAKVVSGTVRLRPYPPGDVDWFAVEAGEPGILTITQFNAYWTKFQIDVHLEGSKKPFKLGYRYEKARSGHGDNDCVSRLLVPPGTHKFRLSSGTRVALQEVEFDLVPNDTKDAYEPNNTRELGKRAPLDETIRFRIIPGDSDWFHFDAPADGIATFHFTKSPSPTDPAVNLYNAGDERPTPVNWFSWDGGLSGTQRNFQRAVPVKKGRVDFVVTDRAGRLGDNILNLEVRFFERAKEQDSNLVVIGFQAGDSANAQIDAIAGVGGGKAVATTQPARLSAVLEQTVEEAEGRRVEAVKRAQAARQAAERQAAEKQRETAAGSNAPWIVAVAATVIALVIIGVLRVLRRKRSASGPRP